MGIGFRRIFKISLKGLGAAGRTPRIKFGPRFYTAKPELWDAGLNVPLSLLDLRPSAGYR
jgi:hypothetical protein